MTATPSYTDATPFISSTSQVGMVLASYDQLVAAFGRPHLEGPDLDPCSDRVTAEWRIRSRAGVMTIYDRTAWTGEPRSADPFWWDIGAHADEHTDKALHPVVALVHELTGCPIKDKRPWCSRPDGLMPELG